LYVEVELKGGVKQKIKLTEEEYDRIFEQGDKALLIQKVKEFKKNNGYSFTESNRNS